MKFPSSSWVYLRLFFFFFFFRVGLLYLGGGGVLSRRFCFPPRAIDAFFRELNNARKVVVFFFLILSFLFSVISLETLWRFFLSLRRSLLRFYYVILASFSFESRLLFFPLYFHSVYPAYLLSCVTSFYDFQTSFHTHLRILTRELSKVLLFVFCGEDGKFFKKLTLPRNAAASNIIWLMFSRAESSLLSPQGVAQGGLFLDSVNFYRHFFIKSSICIPPRS